MSAVEPGQATTVAQEDPGPVGTVEAAQPAPDILGITVNRETLRWAGDQWSVGRWVEEGGRLRWVNPSWLGRLDQALRKLRERSGPGEPSELKEATESVEGAYRRTRSLAPPAKARAVGAGQAPKAATGAQPPSRSLEDVLSASDRPEITVKGWTLRWAGDCFAVGRWVEGKNRRRWRSSWWFPRLDQALIGLLERACQGDVSTLNELVHRVERVYREVVDALPSEVGSDGLEPRR